MFEEASNRITVWLSKTKIISSDQEVVCKWGMTHILDTLFNIATFTAIGLLFRMLPETAVFTVAYIPLRSFAGGYHAKTPFRCWVISNFLLIAALLIVRYVSHFTAFFLLLTALSLLCLVVLMPVSDIHKKLSEKDRKKYRRKGLMILMVEICASAMLCYFALINFSYSIFSAWILLSIMLIGGKIKNGVQAKKWEKVHFIPKNHIVRAISQFFSWLCVTM